jgi:hypothetical protein
MDITLPTGQHLYYSRIKMVIPAGGSQVRQCSFYLPIIEIDPTPWKENDLEATPQVIVRLDNGTPGVPPPMKVYDKTVVPDEAVTEIKISAVTNSGEAIQRDIYCTLLAIGNPLPPSKESGKKKKKKK